MKTSGPHATGPSSPQRVRHGDVNVGSPTPLAGVDPLVIPQLDPRADRDGHYTQWIMELLTPHKSTQPVLLVLG